MFTGWLFGAARLRVSCGAGGEAELFTNYHPASYVPQSVSPRAFLYPVQSSDAGLPSNGGRGAGRQAPPSAAEAEDEEGSEGGEAERRG